MKAIHLISSLSAGDAMGNYVREIDRLFREQPGVDSQIYALSRDDRSLRSCHLLQQGCFEGKEIDLLSYQFGTSSPVMVEAMRKTKAKKKILFYHNVTPSHFFEGYHQECVETQTKARHELDQLRDVVDCSIAMSEYSAQELRERGFKNVHVVPFLTNFKRYDVLDDELDEALADDESDTILFMGRVVPHKGHLDLIKAFSVLVHQLGRKARLFLVGGGPFPQYDAELRHAVKDFQLEDHVVITGRVSDPALNTYLKHADLFVSMSEHEGFFVPLVECMHLQIPILAYAAAAVPETLGDGGFLFSEKDPAKVALLMDEVLSDPQRVHQIRVGQERQLSRFDFDVLSKKIWELCVGRETKELSESREMKEARERN